MLNRFLDALHGADTHEHQFGGAEQLFRDLESPKKSIGHPGLINLLKSATEGRVGKALSPCVVIPISFVRHDGWDVQCPSGR